MVVSYPSHFNLARHCLSFGLNTQAQKTAVIFIESEPGQNPVKKRYTYQDLHRLSAALMVGLAESVPGGPPPLGSRILIRLPHSPAFGLFFLAAIRMGLIAVPASPRLTAGEVGRLIDNSQPAVVVTGDQLPTPQPSDGSLAWRDFVSIDAAQWLAWLELEPPLEKYDVITAADDPAFLIYTSGTSGKPKGVLHAQRSLAGRRPMYEHWLDLHPDDRLLHAGEFNWTYTLGVGFCDPLTVGATAVLYGGSRTKQSLWLNLIEENDITIFAAVPGIYRRLLKYAQLDGHRMPSLRHGVTAGEALSPGLYRSWREQTGKPLYEALGMSEISTYISSGPSAPTKPGSPGKVQPGRRVAILPTHLLEQGMQREAPSAGTPTTASPSSLEVHTLEDGQVGLLAVHRSDPGLMLDYWQRPAWTDEPPVFFGEWFAGGDLASIDSDGYLQYHGRVGDVLNAGGYRTSPLEIERVICEHPAVAEAAVGAIHLEDGLTLLVAFVVLREGLPRPTKEEMHDLCAGHLADYKVPREFLFISDLPRLASGKLARRQLGELFQTIQNR